jgi:hypothetical protein
MNYSENFMLDTSLEIFALQITVYTWENLTICCGYM